MPTPTPTPIPEPQLETLETDDGGNITEEVWKDYAGNPVEVNGYTVHRMTWSKKKLVSETFCDAAGQPVTIGDNWATIRYTYDGIGNVNRIKYFDTNDQPVLCRDGYSIVYREFDSYNRVIYEKFFGTDGFAIMLPSGIVSWRYEYDDNGALTQTTGYDFADKQVTP